MNNLLIYGPPACGKTTFGKKLAETYKLQFIDLDKEIEERTGDTIEEIVSILGEKGFRQVEEDIFNDVVMTHSNAIVALGGGTLLSPGNKRVAQAENAVVCLDWDLKVLESNFLNDNKARPFCKDGIESYRRLLDERREHYKSFGNYVVSAFIDPKPQEQNGLSTILIGKFLPNAIASTILAMSPKSKMTVVYDKNVEKQARLLILHLDSMKCFSGALIGLEVSEEMKTIDTVTSILDKLSEVDATRDDILVSIGGGITSDIVGFAASTWKRGIRWINIPTTLLAIVDASVGGKTGVNFKNAKNSVGAFHKPSLVFVDCSFLSMLDLYQLKQGYAEAYKHYLLDKDLADKLTLSGRTIVEALLSIADVNAIENLQQQKTAALFLNTKLKVVKEDPFERDHKRVYLNLGHTIAHAIEICSKHKISHGEAVSIGICEELKLADKFRYLKDKKLLDLVKQDLSALGLPTELPLEIEIRDLVNIMQKDKKNLHAGIKFVFLESRWKPIEGEIIPNLLLVQ